MDSAVPTSQELQVIGQKAGLDQIKVASAEFFSESYKAITERKAAGLHGGMWFTYGRPERSCDPQRALEGAQAIVVAALSYSRRPPDAPSGVNARVGQVQWEDHYAKLRIGLEVIHDDLLARGFKARVLVDDNLMVDRAAAVRAGLGWFGKNTNVLIPRKGSWFVLGTVVTDAPITPDQPTDENCGTCVACIDDCPTGAIIDDSVLDARKCLAWLLQADGVFPIEYREALGGRIYGCDDCQVVCPANRLADRRSEVPVAIEADRIWVDIVNMLGLSDEDLLEKFADWYIPRRQPDYLRRNALVVLGNIADAQAHEVETTLIRYLEHESPMLVAHAIWAARRLGRDDLLTHVTNRSNELVKAELANRVVARGTESRGSNTTGSNS